MLTNGMPLVTIEVASPLSGGSSPRLYYETVAQFVAHLGTGATFGVGGSGTVSVDTWYWLELILDVSGSTWTLDWKQSGTDRSASTISAGAGTTVNSIVIGQPNASAVDVYIACVVYGTASSVTDWPGEFTGRAHSPTGVGTHNLDAATSAYFFKDISSTETALTSAETNSYIPIDDVPLDTDSDHILVRAATGGAGGSLPVFQASVSHTGNPTTAPSCTLGTTAANDILIAVVTSGGSNTIPTLGGTYNGGAWTAVDSGTLSTTGAVAVYWSRCTGNHSGQTVTSTTVDSGSLVVSRYNNVYAGGSPIGANKQESSTTNAANPGLSAFTTTTANSKVILAVGADDNLAAISAASATSALTFRAAPTSSGGADSGVGLLDRDQATAGTTGAFTTTWGANAAGTGKYLLGFELLGAASLTQPTNTWYTEHTFSDSSESSAPTAVRAVVVHHQDSAANCSITAKLYEGSNEENVYSGDINSTSRLYHSKTFAQRPNSGGAWTNSAFNALSLRWGYTSDADGTPRLGAAMLEAIFVVGGATPVTAEDTGAGADISDLTAVYGPTEAGSGADTVVEEAPYAVIDTGAGVDIGLVTVPKEGTDTGSGVEGTITLSTTIPIIETGVGADAAAETAALSRPETGVGNDTVAETAAYVLVDTGAGADISAVSVPKAGTDIGAGVDTALETAAYLGTDPGSSADATALTASYPLTDTGAGVDAILTLVAGVQVSDVLLGVDSSQIMAALATLDAVAGVDTSILVVLLATTESGIGVDISTLDAGGTFKTGSDSGSGTDVISGRAVQLPETGTSTETAVPTFATARTETGAGVDLVLLTAAHPRTDTGALGTETAALVASLLSAELGTVVEPAQIQALLVLNDAGAGLDVAAVANGLPGQVVTAIIVRKEDDAAIVRKDSLQGTTLAGERITAIIVPNRPGVET